MRINTKLKACPQKKQTIFQAETQKGKGYTDYLNITKELLKRLERVNGFDLGKAKDSLFGNIKKAKEPQSIETEIKSETLSHHVDPAPPLAEVNKPGTEENRAETSAKWQQFDKVTALLTSEQKEGLAHSIAKRLMKHRSKELKGNEDKERITANTLIRALIRELFEIRRLSSV